MKNKTLGIKDSLRKNGGGNHSRRERIAAAKVRPSLFTEGVYGLR
jgi:hypothetical protein